MSVATTSWAAPEATSPAPAAPPPAGRHRAPRHLLLGLALMVGFSLLFAALALRADPASPVLTVAGPVPAGAVISDADLAVVRMVPDPGMRVFTEADRSQVVGSTAAVPLAPGSVLLPAHIGAPSWPPAGESVVAVALAAGQVPAGLVAGSQVTVLVVSASGGDGTPQEGDVEQGQGSPAAVGATVVDTAVPDVAGQVVVSLLLPSPDARLVAAAGGEGVSLLLEHPTGGS